MGNYLINNGPSWVNFCNCEINIKDHNNIWQYINPYKCGIKYWTGTEWCLFELNNIFNYEQGQSPSLTQFETQIGFSLINGYKFGDTIVFDNVGYNVNFEMFRAANLIDFLKCSALSVDGAGFAKNALKSIYLPINTNIDDNGFTENQINNVYLPSNLSIGNNSFNGNNIKYFNAPLIQNIGTTTGNNGVFAGNTGNNVTVIAPSIHQTSNAGGLEGDLAYLQANNTVTFNWGIQEVPDWVNTCGTL
jgi:hypothetical protein